MMFFVLRALVLLTAAIAALLLWRRLGGLPANHPRAFQRRGRRPTTRTLVVCAGDSITQGVSGADYVAQLRARLEPQGYEFVNAGVNGDLSENLLRRLDAIIACDPHAVTVQIGTNDILASLDARWEAYFTRSKGLRHAPTVDRFRRNLDAVLDRLQAETSASIAVLSMPMLGEDLHSATNRRVERYNATVKAVADARGLTYLPLHETLTAILQEDGLVPCPPFGGAQRPTVFAIARAMLHHHLLRRDWDAIAAGNGLRLLTDHIHLNERAAAVVASLIAAWLTQRERESP